MTDKCSRCEYFLHEYEKSFCPRNDKMLLAFAQDDPKIIKDAIKQCEPEEVRAPRSWWTKKEIIRVCKAGGATYETIKLMEKIPLADLRAILLKYMGQEPRGRFSEIWQKPPSEWEEVRRTAMYGIRWGQIDEWNKATRRICATCANLQYEGPGEWDEVYICVLNPPWAMWGCQTKEKSCNQWRMKD